jgi:ABC-2 type transport system ATP-binding protein
MALKEHPQYIEDYIPELDPNAVVKTEGISKVYKYKMALQNVNLTISKGEIYGLVGKNGAGKTTLIRLLMDIIRPTAGTYQIKGASAKEDLIAVRRTIAAMVETPTIYPNMTARDNLKTRCILLGITDPTYIDNRLHEVGLDDVIAVNKKAGKFSLGMKQRLGIAMAIMGDPDLLILDEPTNGLDPEGIKQMRDLFIHLNSVNHVTIIISSHILSELSKFATSYAFIDQGRIVKEITNKELQALAGKQVVVEVPNLIEAKNLLDAAPSKPRCRYFIKGDKLVFTDYESSSQIINLLMAINLQTLSFHEESYGLEDYYLSLIGGHKNV